MLRNCSHISSLKSICAVAVDLELQVSNAALAVVVRALRRCQQINSELRVLQSQKSVPVSGNSTSDLVAAVADELTNMPPGPAAASLLPVVMETAIKETPSYAHSAAAAPLTTTKDHDADVHRLNTLSMC